MGAFDAGTIYSSARIKLDDLKSDVNKVIGEMDRMAKSVKESGKSVENLGRIGKDMSLKVTAPLIAAGVAAVKFASDASESMNAATVVFKGASKTITDFSKVAATEMGLSAAEFNQTAAVIGAGFSNAGYSLQDAANETINLSKRASDMASIFNTDVSDALGAVQSALRGEYEPARRFAVTLSEAAVQAEAQRLGLVKAGQELDTYGKTQARLSLIMQQTNQFAGDFKNTSDGLANSTRITTAMLKNEAAELGTQLLPVALDLIKAMRGIVENFAALDDETKGNIIRIAALAAGIGPLILGVTKAVEVVNTLKIALVALSANPIGLAVAGVAALAAGLAALGEANNKRMLEEVGSQFGDMAKEAGLTAQKISDIQEALALSGKGGFSFEDVKNQVQQISEDLGVSVDQVMRIALGSDKVSSSYKVIVKSVADVLAAEKVRLSYIPGTTEFMERQKRAAEATATAESTIATEKSKQAAIDKRYGESRELVLDILESEKSEYEKIQEQIAQLESTPWASGKLEEERLAAIDVLKRKLIELTAETTSFGEVTVQTWQEMNNGQDALLNNILSYPQALKAAEDAILSWQEKGTIAAGYVSDGLSAVLNLVNAINNSRVEGAQIAYDREYENAKAAGATEEELAALKEKNEKKLAKMRYEAAMQSWELQLALTTAQAAQAVLNAYSSAAATPITGWLSAPVAASLAAGIGGLQLAAVAAAKPIKNYATGGIEEPRGTGTLINVAENGYREIMFNEGPSGVAWTNQMGAAIAANLSERLVVQMNDRDVGKMIDRYLGSGRR